MLASMGMSLMLYFATTKLSFWLNSGLEIERAFTLVVLVIGGIFTFGVLAWIGGAVERGDLKSLR